MDKFVEFLFQKKSIKINKNNHTFKKENQRRKVRSRSLSEGKYKT